MGNSIDGAGQRIRPIQQTRRRRTSGRAAAVTIVAAIVGVTAGAARAWAGAELLVNANLNLDADANGQPDNWSNWSYGSTSFTAYKTSPTDPFTENGSPYVNAGNYGDWWSSGGGWFQTVPGGEGAAYRLAVDCATEAWDNAAGEERLIYLDSTGAVIRQDVQHTAEYQSSQPWTTFNLTTLAPAGTTQVKAEMATWGARGSVMWENASMVATHVWNVDADGSTSVGSNWLGGAPGGADSEAQLLGNVSADRAITIDAPLTLGSLRFDGGTYKYTLGGATLTIDTTDATSGAINVLSGSHQIDAAVSLAKDTSINVNGAANVLTLTNLQPTSAALAKGGAGALVVNAIHAGALSVNAGTVRIAPTASPASATASTVGALNIALGAAPGTSLDLTNNGLVVDYTGDSVLPTVQAQITSAYNAGSRTGNGITTSQPLAATGKTAIGYRESQGAGTFLGQPVDSSAVLVRYTLSGDSDLSGSVDLTDFTFLAANFNGAGKGWSRGNFNYDAAGTVDLTDFTLLAANYNSTLPGGDADAALAIPPTSIVPTKLVVDEVATVPTPKVPPSKLVVDEVAFLTPTVPANKVVDDEVVNSPAPTAVTRTRVVGQAAPAVSKGD